MRIAFGLFWIFVLCSLALGYLESPPEARPLSEISSTYRSDTETGGAPITRAADSDGN